jgi:hypothetical protein
MGRPRYPGVEDIRYINPITGVASSKSRYIDEQGIKKIIDATHIEYQVNGEWVKPYDVPQRRENRNKALSSKNGYFCAKLATMNKKVEDRKKQGKFLQGKYEFKDERYGRCDKFMAHFDKQVERYGNKCPMTHIPFTMDITIRKYDINNYSNGVYSNVSPDRIFNHIDYTEQNTIFTSQLWNFSKKTSSISELEFIFLPEVLERYKAIVVERFPDQKYVL